MSSKITKSQTFAAISNMLKATKISEYKKIGEKVYVLADKINSHLIKKNLTTVEYQSFKDGTMSKIFLDTTKYLTVTTTYRFHLNTSGYFNMNLPKHYSGIFREEKNEIKHLKTIRGLYNYPYVVDKTDILEYHEELESIFNEIEVFKNNVASIIRESEAVIGAFSTQKRLLEHWPELEPYWPVKQVSTNLVKNTKSLNEKIGLPV